MQTIQLRSGTENEPQTDDPIVVRHFLVPLMNGGLAAINVPVPITEEDFDQIVWTLKFWKKVLVRRKPKIHLNGTKPS